MFPMYSEDVYKRQSKGALAKATPMVPPGGAGIGMHVIPVEQAIQMEDRSVSIEHIEHWLDKYEGKYAASPLSLIHIFRLGARRRPQLE